MTVRITKLDHKEVVTEGGNILGSVVDWELDPETWQVTGIVIKVRRDMLEELRLKKPMIGTQEIVVATTHISGVANRVVLNKKLNQFAKLTGAEAAEITSAIDEADDEADSDADGDA